MKEKVEHIIKLKHIEIVWLLDRCRDIHSNNIRRKLANSIKLKLNKFMYEKENLYIYYNRLYKIEKLKMNLIINKIKQRILNVDNELFHQKLEINSMYGMFGKDRKQMNFNMLCNHYDILKNKKRELIKHLERISKIQKINQNVFLNIN